MESLLCVVDIRHCNTHSKVDIIDINYLQIAFKQIIRLGLRQNEYLRGIWWSIIDVVEICSVSKNSNGRIALSGAQNQTREWSMNDGK